MKEDYKAAKRKADKAVRDAMREGRSPYPPVLDSIEEVKHATVRRSLGLLELPLSRIKGNKEAGRNTAFACNFMPLLEEGTEFAQKWSALYDSYKTEGIRDAIKVYEYMNEYYVQEGNKRVSVSKFGGTEYILADVTRIIPPKSDDPEVVAYYEYMDFFKCTKNFLIVFTEPGAYAKLAELLGQNLEEPWPQDLCSDLRSAFFRFSKVVKREMKIEDEHLLSNAFLMYLCIFPLKTFSEDSDQQILKNIRLSRYDLLASQGQEGVEFLTELPQQAAKQQGSFMSLFSKERKYTESSPLKVGFVYDDDPDLSRWIDSHEAGRLYVEGMNSGNVVTQPYFTTEIGSVADTFEKAVADGNEIIFAVSPNMARDELRAAVVHPEVKFLNCSIGQQTPSMRCYHGKLYEAAFLMGILAANTLLLEYGEETDRKIGYFSRVDSPTERANLNAFAVGVSLIAPDCKVEIIKMTDDHDVLSLAREGFKIYADIEISHETKSLTRPGVYKYVEGKYEYIGASFFNWGKYYLQIVNSVLNGTWNISEMINSHLSTNYWFGISTGVVDIRIPGASYQTKKMLSFFRNSITTGGLDPFSGEIFAQGGVPVNDNDNTVPDSEIMRMTWLNDNIVGEV